MADPDTNDRNIQALFQAAKILRRDVDETRVSLQGQGAALGNTLAEIRELKKMVTALLAGG